LKLVMRYVKKTLAFGLLYGSCGGFSFVVYSDSSLSIDRDSHKSTIGFCFQLGTSLVI
ncbi:hypothetical protein SELMODRAFT_131670, partial [Selaginella moellendorffii]